MLWVAAQSAQPIIRPETPGDHRSIRELVAAAFGSDAEALLVDRIRSSPECVPELALVAEIDGQITGHVMISYARLRNDRTERAISMLSPLAVLPPHQRVGIGFALVNAALAVAEARSEPLVILEGDPAYYGRLGFEHSQQYGIEIHLPNWAPPEAAQVKLLNAFDPDDPSLRGTVIYPTAFDGLEYLRLTLRSHAPCDASASRRSGTPVARLAARVLGHAAVSFCVVRSVGITRQDG